MPLSFAKSLRRHHKDLFPLDVSISVLDGRLIRRPAKDARRKCEPCLVRVSRTRVLSSELLLVSLRCHRIAMVQPAESRKGLNLAFTRRANFRCTTCWRALRQNSIPAEDTVGSFYEHCRSKPELSGKSVDDVLWSLVPESCEPVRHGSESLLNACTSSYLNPMLDSRVTRVKLVASCPNHALHYRRVRAIGIAR